MTSQTAGIVQARRTDTASLRERVLKALDAAVQAREEISVAGIARRAGVDHTFLYRHSDLLGMIQTQAAEPPLPRPETLSRPSLMADLANAQDRNTRLAEENRLLRERLSAVLGEEIWREAGLGGAAASMDQFPFHVTELEQRQSNCGDGSKSARKIPDAARSVNREYMARINGPLAYPS